jgi:short-subunit dehydrogenase
MGQIFSGKTVLILGANSDVAKEVMRLYVSKGCRVIAASRSTEQIRNYVDLNITDKTAVDIRYFDAVAFETHQQFYNALPVKPHIVLYAAGFQVTNDEALISWEGTFQMIKVLYAGAVSILNIVAMDISNKNLERIIGLSSLSGVRGRKSNFIYGSTKSAFTQYLAGLRQYLFSRDIQVNAIVSGYIRSKLTAGLELTESLMLEPSFVAEEIVNAGNVLIIVPGWKWKIIYFILKSLPERLVSKLP